jgi:septum formation protein
MSPPLILASTSPTRAALLRAAGIDFAAMAPRLDEAAIRDALMDEGASPRDISDTLAAMKAARIAAKRPEAWVIGADQVLDIEGTPLGKPGDRAEARDQLLSLSGRTHRLHTAVVVHADGAPVWREVSEARMTMRPLTPGWVEGYLDRMGDAVTTTVGAYQIESEGIRLFSRIEGDYFGILGLPLTPLINYLTLRKVIPA